MKSLRESKSKVNRPTSAKNTQIWGTKALVLVEQI